MSRALWTLSGGRPAPRRRSFFGRLVARRPDVGGARYAAQSSTLLACRGSHLFAMFEGLAQGGEATECPPPEGIPGEVRAPLPKSAR